MSTFDDPNREAVGLPPIWTEGDAEPEAKPAAQTKSTPNTKTTKKAAKNEDGGDD